MKCVADMSDSGFLKVVEKAKPFLDQIRLNICLCERGGKILYVILGLAALLDTLGGSGAACTEGWMISFFSRNQALEARIQWLEA